TPDDGGTTPDDGGTTPDDGGTTPDDGGTTPDDGGTTPDDGGTTPDDGGTTPDEGDTTTEPPSAILQSIHLQPFYTSLTSDIEGRIPATVVIPQGDKFRYQALGTYLNSDGTTSVEDISERVDWKAIDNPTIEIPQELAVERGEVNASMEGKYKVSAELDGIRSKELSLEIQNATTFMHQCHVLGGGEGYHNIIDPETVPHVVVRTFDELNIALKSAPKGGYVFVPSDVAIELPNKREALRIPEGVTLFSDRGLNGHPGAKLWVKDIQQEAKWPVIQAFRNSRFSGFRFEGPYSGEATDFGRSTVGISMVPQHNGVLIDNNEIYGWPWAAVQIRGGGNYLSADDSGNHRIVNNVIHDNLKTGLGYGVVVQTGGQAEISCNVFADNRHSVAGSGDRNDGYYLHHNLFLPASKPVNSYRHAVDMHGEAESINPNPLTRDAGKFIDVRYNWVDFAFVKKGTSYQFLVLRGVPTGSPIFPRRNAYVQGLTFESYPGSHLNRFVHADACHAKNIDGGEEECIASVVSDDLIEAENRYYVDFTYSQIESEQCFFDDQLDSYRVNCKAISHLLQ
ncbi:hypothetical protein ACL00O_19835, partial [Aeromonas sanarellii]|uniref:hypothetical protein n=1 Tax=Aeromonas sanarellii TaxID=633415 RepID=UPI00399FE0CB